MGVLEEYSHLYAEIHKERSELFAYLRSTPNTPPTWEHRKKADERARECSNELEILEAGGIPTDFGKEKASLSVGRTAARQGKAERIEAVRELMQREIDSTAWPRDKQGRDGLLGFVWRKHEPAIKRMYGEVKYDTIRRKTTPAECKKLGLKPLPK